METTLSGRTPEPLRALPGDGARRIMWRIAGRQHLPDNLAQALAAFELARLDTGASRLEELASEPALPEDAGQQGSSLTRDRLAAAAGTAARLLSAVEPILRRLRASSSTDRAGVNGITGVQREDALDRLVGVCAAGEATASLAFAAARAHDDLDPIAAVLGPACRLWSAYAGGLERETAILIARAGARGDTRVLSRPTWLDTAPGTYDTEALDQQQLAEAMTTRAFLAQFRSWVADMRRIASARPGTGACTLGSAMELWLWVLARERSASARAGAEGQTGPRLLIAFGLAEALCWLLAARCQILDALELESAGPADAGVAAGLPALNRFLGDLCHVQAARAAGEVGRIAADLVHGYNRHPAWDAEGCAACYGEADLADLEQLIPGIESTAGAYDDVIALDGTHKPKAGPCVRFKGLDDFVRLRSKLDGCLTGSRLARERAAEALGGM